MKSHHVLGIFAFSALIAGNVSAVNAATLTNEDVTKMVKGGIDEETIVLSIESSQTAFDTSTDALLALRKQAVPTGVINAMIKAGHSGIGQSPAASPIGSMSAPETLKFNPETITWENGTDQISLQYIIPSTRTAVRALGWGGVATYMVLSGSNAVRRITNRQPSFLVAVPENAQPTSYMTLANFATRQNQTREVLVAGGAFGSYSTGITQDRIVPTRAEKASNQDGCPKDFVIFRVVPLRPLAPGEYGLILNNRQYRTQGFFLNVMSNSCFDFGIDTPR